MNLSAESVRFVAMFVSRIIFGISPRYTEEHLLLGSCNHRGKHKKSLL